MRFAVPRKNIFILFSLCLILLRIPQVNGFDTDSPLIRPFFVATQESDQEAVIRKISPDQNTSEVVFRLPALSDQSAKQLLSQHEIDIFEGWMQTGAFPLNRTYLEIPLSPHLLNIWQLDDSHILLLISHQLRVMSSGEYSIGNYELSILDINTHESKSIWNVEFHDLLTRKLDGDYSVNRLTVRQVVPNPTQDKIAIMLSPEPLSFCCSYIPTTLIVDYAESAEPLFVSKSNDARWSPDGKQLAYFGYNDDIPHVYSLESKQDTVLAVQPIPSESFSGFDRALDWSNNHTLMYTWPLYLTMDDTNHHAVMLYDTQANKPIKTITEVPVQTGGIYRLYDQDQEAIITIGDDNVSQLNLTDDSLENLQTMSPDKVYYNTRFNRYLMINANKDSHNLFVIDAHLKHTTIDLTKMGILKDTPIIDISP